jgi:hypothetical protein
VLNDIQRQLNVVIGGVLVMCALPAGASCGGGGGAPGGGRGGAGGSSATGSGRLSATIDGQAWAADQSTIQVTGSSGFPGALTINGTRTYPLGVNPDTNAGGTVSIFDQAGTGSPGIWMTDLSGARGTLTVTAVSGSRAAGLVHGHAPGGRRQHGHRPAHRQRGDVRREVQPRPLTPLAPGRSMIRLGMRAPGARAERGAL